MPIYLIVPLTPMSSSEPLKLDEAIESVIESKDRYQLPFQRGWLVHFPGTTIEVSNLIGISRADKTETAKTEPALVTMVPSYYGRASTDVWDWLFTRMDK
jgi:hypothetical protein